tara:strand:- start:118 stop:855 length:738 start_codon:yes stop_codon:yes gene_type:complete
MPVIHANSSGIVINANQSSHANARDASSGANGENTTSTAFTVNSYVVGPARGGGLAYRVDRIFMYFDTSGITSAPTSATLSINRTTAAPVGKFRIIKSTAFGGDGGTNLAAGDFDALVGFSAGNTMDGNVTEYAGSVDASAWGTSNAYNDTDITLNSTALSDMASNDFFILAVINQDFDYKNIDGGVGFHGKLPHYQVASSGTGKDPKIDYVTAGYGNDVIGLASANIGEINAVATGDIAELNGL